MTPERAREIVSAINDRCFFTMGLVDRVKSLAGISLAEMIEASRIIEEGNRQRALVRGRYTIQTVPDDRLIAAAYCMEHYPVSNEAIVTLPMRREERFWHEKDCKAPAIVAISSSDAAGDDAEEAA